jgi:hypothetical protein
MKGLYLSLPLFTRKGSFGFLYIPFPLWQLGSN